MIRVVVADDQALVRGGFRMMLDHEPDMEVVAEAPDGHAALRLAREHAPDVVLMDVRMPRMDGIEATRALMISARPPKVLVLTTYDLDEYVVAALRAGASGYLLKDVEPTDLTAAIRTVVRGDLPLAPAVLRRVVDLYLRTPRPDDRQPLMTVLTAREREILLLVADGLTNAEIAERLVVSGATVKTHVANILAKLGLRDRIQAVILAYECGLVTPSAPMPAAKPLLSRPLPR